MSYRVVGWYSGSLDCEPPEPGKRWLEVVDGDDETVAVFVQRVRAGVYRLEDTRNVHANAELVARALNFHEKHYTGRDA